MQHSIPPTRELHALIDRIQAGDRQAQNDLLQRVEKRLGELAQRMLRAFPKVGQWESFEDVLQKAQLRLLRALEVVRPESTRSFLGLAAEQIRRELLDLARHYSGPRRVNPRVADMSAAGPDHEPGFEPAQMDESLGNLERWRAFHEAVADLPVEEREVVSLRFYHGWTFSQMAELFNVNDRTIRRRWSSACLKLNTRMGGEVPEL